MLGPDRAAGEAGINLARPLDTDGQFRYYRDMNNDEQFQVIADEYVAAHDEVLALRRKLAAAETRMEDARLNMEAFAAKLGLN